MKKKIFIAIINALIIILTVFYYRPIGVNKLIQPFSSKNLPSNIKTEIFFSALSEKALDVTNEASIKELINLIENMKVRKNIITTRVYSPQLKETYRLFINGEDNSHQYIYILNNEYIQINHVQYRIIGRPDLSRIYDIIILDQAEGILDRFYYDLINK